MASLMCSNRHSQKDLVVSSETSLLTDGPAGYKEAMQITHDWSQGHFFKMGNKHMDPKTLITCVLFPQPLLPYVKLAETEGVEKLMLTHMHMVATCHKSVRCVQSETDLVGIETVERLINDRLFDAVHFTSKPNLKNCGNPLYGWMSIKLRLEDKAKWLTKDR